MKKSYAFVAIQFTAIFILIFTGSIFPSDIVIFIIMILFLLFGLWAMFVHRFRFNALPVLRDDSSLKTSGPYRFVRHPMYTSLIFITLIWVLYDFTIIRLAIWIILLITIYLKSEYEEQLLIKKFPEYPQYKTLTKKFIPFIY
ncbi:MAG: isoprenylcysteine carboxylmethyltransferase family protein [Bacteroidetes bacterium]|nr:isoprenylcysteine carboxylmethyltransferase family protein [Bacteroidota bacterium]